MLHKARLGRFKKIEDDTYQKKNVYGHVPFEDILGGKILKNNKNGYI